MMRWDIIDTLRRTTGAQRFAQILTTTTSIEMRTQREVDRFPVATTLMYASPEQCALAKRKRYPIVTVGLDELIEIERACPTRADIAFVDPWHTYEDSLAALHLAMSMLSPLGGSLVVHDCNPPTRELAGPPEGAWEDAWCGSTWRAFVDLTANLPAGADWCVVDTDYGVGVVRLPPTDLPAQRPGRWRGSVPASPPTHFTVAVPEDHDHDQAWEWLEEDRVGRLRLTSPTEWSACFDDTVIDTDTESPARIRSQREP